MRRFPDPLSIASPYLRAIDQLEGAANEWKRSYENAVSGAEILKHLTFQDKFLSRLQMSDLTAHYQALASTQVAVREWQNRFSGIAKDLSSCYENITRIQDFVSPLDTMARAFGNDLKHHYDVATSVLDRFSSLGIGKSLAVSARAFSPISAADLAKRLDSLGASSQILEMAVNLDDTVLLGDRTIAMSEIEKDVTEFMSDLVDTRNIEYSLEKRESRWEHAYRSLILSIIACFLFSVFLQPVADYARTAVQKNAGAIIKAIRESFSRSEFDREALDGFRIVGVQVLEVRAGKRRKSEFRGGLYFGEIVFMVDKHRKWTYIQKLDTEGQIILEGWVYSRYLKRVQR